MKFLADFLLCWKNYEMMKFSRKENVFVTSSVGASFLGIYRGLKIFFLCPSTIVQNW